jgi:hypothetical protein
MNAKGICAILEFRRASAEGIVPSGSRRKQRKFPWRVGLPGRFALSGRSISLSKFSNSQRYILSREAEIFRMDIAILCKQTRGAVCDKRPIALYPKSSRYGRSSARVSIRGHIQISVLGKYRLAGLLTYGFRRPVLYVSSIAQPQVHKIYGSV